ncbi:MAG: hypothetical protein IKV86_07105 [Clostridia bacterium]|nr:hypothetical protein [Clostridia bacterium]
MGKIIDGYKKRQSLIIGLLIFAFLALLFMQTLSITERYPDEAVKDFSIMRPVGVPTQGDVKTVLGIFENELGDKYNFDSLYNNVYVLFVMGLVSLFMCFKKFNKGFISKIVTLAYSGYALYSLLFTDNMAYVLKTYDSTYIAKIVVAALIALVSIGALVFLTIELAKNSWFKFVNVHIFLNSICSAVMLATTSLMFMPFKFEEHSASIMGFLLLPNNYKGGFLEAFRSSIGSTGKDFIEINGIITIPLLLFVIGIMGAIFNAGYHRSMVTPIISIVWAGLCIVGCFLNPLMVLDSKMIIYVVLAAVVIVASVFNIIQHHKANAIYR